MNTSYRFRRYVRAGDALWSGVTPAQTSDPPTVFSSLQVNGDSLLGLNNDSKTTVVGNLVAPSIQTDTFVAPHFVTQWVDAGADNSLAITAVGVDVSGVVNVTDLFGSNIQAPHFYCGNTVLDSITGLTCADINSENLTCLNASIDEIHPDNMANVYIPNLVTQTAVLSANTYVDLSSYPNSVWVVKNSSGSTSFTIGFQNTTGIISNCSLFTDLKSGSSNVNMNFTGSNTTVYCKVNGVGTYYGAQTGGVNIAFPYRGVVNVYSYVDDVYPCYMVIIDSQPS